MANPGNEKIGEGSLLSDEFVRELVAVGQADLLVGIPTLNNAKTIGQVVRAVQIGFAKYFSRERVALIATDGGSTDGTSEAIRDVSIESEHRILAPQSLRTVHRVSTRYQGAPGTGSALRTIIAAAELLRAKACAVVSPDLTSITPEWIDNLLRPVYRERFDLVTPLYRRQRFDGLLMSTLIYPLVRSAYSQRIREPVAGEFAFSGGLAHDLLDQEFWRADPEPFGAEMWITTKSIRGGYRIGQSFLGPKVHGAKDSGQDLVATIRHVVGSVFRCLEADETFWLSKTGSEPVATFGFPYDVSLEPVRVNRKRMLQMFRTGVRELASLLETILSPETYREIQGMAALADSDFRFPNAQWAKTIYDFASSYRHSVMNRDHLVQALTPIYRGWISSFVRENHEADADEVEKAVENLCLDFERLKSCWIGRWNIQK